MNEGDVSYDVPLLLSTSLICQWHNLLLIDFLVLDTNHEWEKKKPLESDIFYLYLLLTDSKMKKTESFKLINLQIK